MPLQTYSENSPWNISGKKLPYFSVFTGSGPLLEFASETFG